MSENKVKEVFYKADQNKVKELFDKGDQNNIFFIDPTGKGWTIEEWKEKRLVYQNYREIDKV